MKQFGVLLAVATAALATVAGPASAAETTLIFATTTVPRAHFNVQILTPWAERINKAGKGVLHIDKRDGPTIANHTNYYSRAVAGVFQIGWGLQAYVGGKFPLTNVVTLPFEVEKSELGSTAFWGLYASGLLNGEYDEIRPIMLVAFPQVGVQLAKKPDHPIETLDGLKLAVGIKVLADVTKRLGGTPLSLPITQYYEALQRGTVDGTLSQWTQFQPYKLGEVTVYHIDTTLGGGAAMVFITNKAYAALPDTAKKLIDANAGEAESRKFGAFWDRINDEWRQKVKAMPGHTVVELSAAQKAKWRGLVAPVVQHWARSTPNGDKVLSRYNSIMAELEKGK